MKGIQILQCLTSKTSNTPSEKPIQNAQIASLTILKKSLNPDPIRDLAVNGIQHHVQGQAQAHKPRIREKTQPNIKCDRPHLMQRVKPYTAAARVINWIRQQVINIDQHSSNQDQVGCFPAVAKKTESDKERNNKMKGDMDH